MFTTRYHYDANGHLSGAQVSDGRPRTVSFVNDAQGQVLVRSEADNNAATGDPRQFYYYANGVQVGSNGNNGNLDPSYRTALAERTAGASGTQGPFRLGSNAAVPYADFDQSYDAINPGNAGNGTSRYTVRSGDTLQSIAATLFGDASLWYIIGEANGLTSSSALTAGQSLTIPGKISNFHNNADTFRPYDASKAIGDTAPTTPRPPKKAAGCGIIGAILLVAVAVTIATQGTAAAFAGSLGLGAASSTGAVIVGGALAAAAGSIASQAVGLATGLQSKFSFKGVAIAALAGGIGGGLGKLIPAGAVASSKLVTDVVRGVAGSVLTQGVATVTGLQSKFSFTGVAVAGVAAGVGGAVRGTRSDFGTRTLAGAASAIAGAGARSLVTGSSFGDNILAVLPDVIGQTIGSAVGEGIVGAGVRGRVVKPDAKLAAKTGDDIIVNRDAITLKGADAAALYSSATTAGELAAVVASVAVQQGSDNAATLSRNIASLRAGNSKLLADLRNSAVGAAPPTSTSTGSSAAPIPIKGNSTFNRTQLNAAERGISVSGYLASGIIDGATNASLGDILGQLTTANVNFAGEFAAKTTNDFQLNLLGTAFEGNLNDPVSAKLAGLVRAEQVTRFANGGAAAQAAANRAVGELLFAGIGAPIAIAGGAAAGVAVGGALLAGEAIGVVDGISSFIAFDYGQSAARGLAGGRFEAASTIGGSAISLATGGRYGEGAYALGTLGFGLGVGGVALGNRLSTTGVGAGASPLTRAEVRAKIFGTAQQTGNDGTHAFRSYREAILLARNPEVEAVYLNKSYNFGLDLAPNTINPNRRPDVLGRYFDGRVARIEVQSATDREILLRARNLDLDSQIVKQGFTPLDPRVVSPRGQ